MNRLAHETSPYLLQHADNPVDWYPWGPEALQKARDTGKPILLSIGYSACHWCHVMAHESFEDGGVAAIMNELYVNIKVDREERPDIDQIYQTAQHMLTRRSGGWPLTMFLTPDQAPFFGGTYFPKTARYGLPGFGDLLRRVRGYYDTHRDDVNAQNAQLLAALASQGPRGTAHHSEFSFTPLDEAIDYLASTFDRERGGFGQAPKFPHPDQLELCLRHYARTGDERALEMVRTTLLRMAEGGIHDHVGGGFSRYSVDATWTIPHFEKMLYDNGPLLRLYSDAWLITREPRFAECVEETAAWLMRDMQSPAGGYYSSLDADSEGEEGKFYVWQRNELQALLSPDEWAVVSRHFDLLDSPNFEEHAWHLCVARPLSAVAAELGLAHDVAVGHLASARTKLFAHRETRIHPGRDDKILTSWNALAISGLARAARVFGRGDWLTSARRAFDFLRTTMWDGKRLFATHKDGQTHLNAYLDDYAYLLDASLRLLEADFRAEEIAFAEDLAECLLDHFEDKTGGFFFTSHDHERLIQRVKSAHDNATPSGNGVAAFALNRLAYVTGDLRYRNAAERTLAIFYNGLAEFPAAHSTLLTALEEVLVPTRTVVLTGPSQQVQQWNSVLASAYMHSTLVLAAESAKSLPPALAKPAGPQVNAYVCEGVSCLPPIADLGELKEALKSPKMTHFQAT